MVLVHYRCIHVFSLGSWLTQIPTDPSWSMVLRNFIGELVISHTRLSRSMVSYSTAFCYHQLHSILKALQPHNLRCGLDSSAFARRYWRNLVLDFYSSGYWDVSVRPVSYIRLSQPFGYLHRTLTSSSLDGFPHSETAGSQDYNSSPTNIAVIYVLPRHEYPGHPLSTLLRCREQRS